MAMSRSLGSTLFTGSPAMEMTPSVGLLETGQHPQQRRLAAPRRAEEDEEVAVVDLRGSRLDTASTSPKRLVTRSKSISAIGRGP